MVSRLLQLDVKSVIKRFLGSGVKAEWIVKLSGSRAIPYYFNTDTKESKWDPPSNLTLEQIMALPGAKEFLNEDGSPKPPPGKAGEVRASHLLVKHAGSRRPASWKEVSLFTYDYPLSMDGILILYILIHHTDFQ